MSKARPVRLLLAGIVVLIVLRLVFQALVSGSGSLKTLALKAGVGDPQSILALRKQGSSAVPGLVRLVNYREGFLKREARAAAPKLPKFYGRLVFKWFAPEQAPSIRVAGARSLGLLGVQAESAVPALLELLHDPEPYVAMEAARSLGAIGSASVPGLVKALGDPDAVVRQAAAFGLGQIGPKAELALPNLLAALDDKHPLVRSSAASSLRLIGQPTLWALSNLLDHADAAVREAGLNEFFQLQRSFLSLTKPLNKMAHAEDAESRCRALAALGALRASDELTIRSFLDALADPLAEVRLAAVKTLSLLGSRAQGATSGLRKCLQDPCVAVREGAAQDLGAIGPGARVAVPDLNDALRDKDESVRKAAQEAINSIGPGASK